MGEAYLSVGSGDQPRKGFQGIKDRQQVRVLALSPVAAAYKVVGLFDEPLFKPALYLLRASATRGTTVPKVRAITWPSAGLLITAKLGVSCLTERLSLPKFVMDYEQESTNSEKLQVGNQN